MAPESSGSCLGHCLEFRGYAVTALTKSLYFEGNLASLAIYPPPWVLLWHFFDAPNLLYVLKGQLLGLIPKLGRQLPDCLGVLMPYELGYRKQ